MKISIFYALLLLFVSYASAQDPKDPPLAPKHHGGMVGFLKGSFYGEHPLSFNQETELTFHYTNISAAPLRLQGISKRTCGANTIWVKVPEKGVTADKEYGRWGPPTFRVDAAGNSLYLNLNSSLDHAPKILVSGVNREDLMNWACEYPQRDLILFYNEAYARKFTFRPGWADPDSLKQFPSGTKALILDATQLLPTSAPLLVPEACQPGKAVQWGTPQKIAGLGSCVYPFQSNMPPSPKQPEVIPEAVSGLTLEIEPPLKLVDGVAFELAWIVGNSGKEPIFVEQNSCCPGVAAWSLNQSGKELYKNDGSDMKPIMDLYPARDPYLLMPGEYLSFRRTFYPAELGWKVGQEHELKLEIKARWKNLDGAKERQASSKELSFKEIREASWQAQSGKELQEAKLSANAKILPQKPKPTKP